MIWKKENRLIAASVLILAILGTVSFCFAAYSGISGIKNKFSTGGISVGVEEYTETSSGEIICKPLTKVKYGSSVSYIPRITNYGEKCYIRVSLTARSGSENINISANCFGIDDEWIKKGEYFYYRHPLQENDSIKLCDGFRVPEDWDYESCNNMAVGIKTEAIQARNFMPDFDSEDPWGKVSIKKSYIDGYKTTNELKEDITDGINIVFEKSADKISADRKTMFNDIKLMPGDSSSDTIRICNTSDKRVKVMFKAVCEDSDLLDDINLEIDNGAIFYNGVLSGKLLNDYREIADIYPGETKEIGFKIHIPAEKGNEAQLKKGQATWYFTIDNSDAVKTGDRNQMWLFAVICIFCCIIILALLRGENNEKNM